MEVIGLPPPHVLAAATRRKVFFDSSMAPRPTVNSQNRTHVPGGARGLGTGEGGGGQQRRSTC